MSQANCRNYISHLFKDNYSIYLTNLYTYVSEGLKLPNDFPEISTYIDITRDVFRSNNSTDLFKSVDNVLLMDYTDSSKAYLQIFQNFKMYPYFLNCFQSEDRSRVTSIFIVLLIHKLCNELSNDDAHFKLMFDKFKNRYIN